MKWRLSIACAFLGQMKLVLLGSLLLLSSRSNRIASRRIFVYTNRPVASIRSIVDFCGKTTNSTINDETNGFVKAMDSIATDRPNDSELHAFHGGDRCLGRSHSDRQRRQIACEREIEEIAGDLQQWLQIDLSNERRSRGKATRRIRSMVNGEIPWGNDRKWNRWTTSFPNERTNQHTISRQTIAIGLDGRRESFSLLRHHSNDSRFVFRVFDAKIVVPMFPFRH